MINNVGDEKVFVSALDFGRQNADRFHVQIILIGLDYRTGLAAIAGKYLLIIEFIKFNFLAAARQGGVVDGLAGIQIDNFNNHPIDVDNGKNLLRQADHQLGELLLIGRIFFEIEKIFFDFLEL